MRALFLVNGLGLGNSTRCHAILQELKAQGADLAVVTSGNGLWYFEGRDEIDELHEVGSFFYASRDGRISVVDTLAAAGTFLRIARDNERIIGGLIERFRPDVVVTDSTYTVCAVKRAGVPLAALNNADVVHVSYRQFPDRPKSVRAQFHAIEENDYRFHRLVPDLSLSPTLDPHLPTVGGPYRRVGPIVRRGYSPRPTSGPVRRILVMLSGSAFGSQVRFVDPLPGVQIDVVGRDAPEGWVPDGCVQWHGKVRDNLHLLEDADMAVVNGGFSAVSELFWMRKPMLVVPVPNHAEQWVNARTIQGLGVGDIASEDNLEPQIHAALARLDTWREGYRRLPDPDDGAAQAAALLLDLTR